MIIEKKILEKIEKTNSCWLWKGSITDRGYGQYSSKLVHRLIWQLKNGPVPKGLELDHLCRVRSCVNPVHLEAVTHAENNRRGNSPSAMAMRKTHCFRGHRLSEDNIYRHKGKKSAKRKNWRICKECHIINNAKFKAKNPNYYPTYAKKYWKRLAEKQ